MSRFIEYYEVKTQNGYEYYFIPVNPYAKNKENLDSLKKTIPGVGTAFSLFAKKML